jgi:AraC family transcriptional regulator of adaptative response/methylated-DNA-[protein]-cysteine methyltransferase
MMIMTVPRRASKLSRSSSYEDDRWRAVKGREASADGRFVYAVKTTGVYCRPSCGARLARRENVEFFSTTTEAERAGFRACKRCRPNEVAPDQVHAGAVARACKLITEADETPDLATLANAAGMSLSHFHRVFKSLTGLTPKAYATAHRAHRVQEALGRGRSVTAAIYDAGFNSSARFYATSSDRLGMKPSAFRAGGEGATIRFAVGECSLGSILVATSQRGICSIALGDEAGELVRELEDRFPKAKLIGGDKAFEKLVARVIGFVERPAMGLNLPLDVRGTAFQERVWRKLCEIPCGKRISYTQLAMALGKPTATRAVAQACAANSIAVAIPCHRVVRTDGSLSGYRWGVERKAKLLARERGGER